MILPENPYVIPNPEVESPSSRLFRCLDNDASSGVFFDVLKRAGKSVPEVREARCVYGGRNCSFDNSVRFIEDTAKLNGSHRFIAGGFLLFMPHRRTQYTIHSQPWFSEKMVVLHRPGGARRLFESAWRQVILPFSNTACLLSFGIVSLLCIARRFIDFRLSGKRRTRPSVRWFDFSKPNAQGVSETACFVFFAGLILAYEVACLAMLDPVNISNIEGLKSLGLRNYAIVEGDASETLFRYAVGWENEKGKVPWVPVRTLGDAITLVRNKSVKYAFSSETAVATILWRDKLDDEICAIPTVKRDSGGWYYGIGIPRRLRQKIDKALGTLVLDDVPRKSLEGLELPPIDCGKLAVALDYKVLIFFPLLIVAAIIIFRSAPSILSLRLPDIHRPDIPSIAPPTIELKRIQVNAFLEHQTRV